MIIVPAVHTPLTAEHARDALLAVLPKLDRESAALLLALVWVETARGNLMNNNPGNFSASDRWPGEAWRPPWYLDTSNPNHQRMLDGQAPSAFRSYPSAAHGFTDFAHGLVHTFPTVLAAAATGDPAEFVKALHDSGYSKDYRAAHIGTFGQLRHDFEPLTKHLPAPHGGAGAGVGLLVVAAALLFVFAKPAKKKRRRLAYSSHGRPITHGGRHLEIAEVNRRLRYGA